MAGVLGALIGSLGKGKPGVPTNVVATDVGTSRAFNNGSANITFTAADTLATSYTVRAYNSSGTYQSITATGASSPINVTGLSSSFQYKYTVSANNAVGNSGESSYSSLVTATTVPATPVLSNLVAGDGQVQYTWTISSNGGKNLNSSTSQSQATPSGGPLINMSLPQLLTATLSHNGLTNGTSYTFTFAISNANGLSVRSASIGPVTPAAAAVPAIAVAFTSTPFVSAYPWSAGFGTKYADPATLPTNYGRCVAFKPQGDAIAVGHSTTPFISAYPWSSGFGTKYANPATLLPQEPKRVTFRPQGDALAAAGNNSPYIDVYPWSAGFGTKYANPGTAIPAGAQDVAFSPAGDAIAVVHNNSPYVTAYPWSAGFGTKYANPATLPSETISGGGITFRPQGDTIAVSTQALSAYPWSAGFGTKYANPVTGAGLGNKVRFTPAGNAIATSSKTSAYIHAYPWSSGFGTKYANPATLPTGQGSGVDFNPAGNAIAVAHSTTPFISAYPWSAGFGTKYADPGTAIPAGASDIAFI